MPNPSTQLASLKTRDSIRRERTKQNSNASIPATLDTAPSAHLLADLSAETPSHDPSSSSAQFEAKPRSSAAGTASPENAFNFKIAPSHVDDRSCTAVYTYQGDGERTDLPRDILSLVEALHPGEDIGALRNDFSNVGPEDIHDHLIYYVERSVNRPEDPYHMERNDEPQTEGTLYGWPRRDECKLDDDDDRVKKEHWQFRGYPGTALQRLKESVASQAGPTEKAVEA